MEAQLLKCTDYLIPSRGRSVFLAEKRRPQRVQTQSPRLVKIRVDLVPGRRAAVDFKVAQTKGPGKYQADFTGELL